MPAKGARVTIRRISLMDESVLGTADTGTVQHLSGLEGEALDPVQERFSDQSQANDRNYTLAPWLGEKKNTLGFNLPLHKLLIPNAGSIIRSALGGRRGSTNITTPGTYTTTSFNFGGGTPHDWVMFTNGSRLIPRPVVRNVAGTAYLGFALPSAGYTPTGVTNPNQYGATTGHSYYEDPGAMFLSLQAQIDRAAEPDSVNYTLKGLVPNRLRWFSQEGQRRMLEVALQGTDWTRETGAQLADAAKPTKQASPWQSECYILSDFAALGANPARTLILGYSVNLAPEWLPLTADTGRSGANEDTIPASPVNEWRRGKSLAENSIEVIVQFAATAWETGRAAETEYDLAFIDYLGNPAGSFTGDCFCQFFPKCRLINVQTVPNHGIDAMRLTFHPRDERDVGNSAGQMSSGLIAKHSFAAFIAA